MILPRFGVGGGITMDTRATVADRIIGEPVRLMLRREKHTTEEGEMM